MSNEKPTPTVPPQTDEAPPPYYAPVAPQAASAYPLLPSSPAEPQLQLPYKGGQPVPQPAPPGFQVVQQNAPAPNVVYVVAPPFCREPMEAFCPNCKSSVWTEIDLVTNCCCCCLLFWFCGLFSLCLLCYDGLKDAEHHCSRCKTLLGRCSGWDSLSGGQKAGVLALAFFLCVVEGGIGLGIRMAIAANQPGNYYG